ncbi:MAG TPA: SCO2523 family variant P-loop protein [Micromonosporaceae bacterium]|jgi:hypothetical protein|nr:SCO2523 family variant P-loop protein [Micromonosporaceae bacterium]
MLVFATSDKGGTGRSVTSSNLVYRKAIDGSDTAYLDFDFGSPTAGAIFAIGSVERGTTEKGLHSYLHGDVEAPHRLDVWATTERRDLRRPDGAGQLCLFPGDQGGGEFAATPEMVDRCVRLLLRMEEEFQLALIDLSAGRSHATEIVLAATARPELSFVTARWLVFHRWTPQHIIAAAGLVHGDQGILTTGERLGHDRDKLANSIRFVRTAVVDPNSEELAGLRPAQAAWLRERNQQLQMLASHRRVGRTSTIGEVPLDPVLQWQEQLISDDDTITWKIANPATVDSFIAMAKVLDDDEAWLGI